MKTSKYVVTTHDSGIQEINSPHKGSINNNHSTKHTGVPGRRTTISGGCIMETEKHTVLALSKLP